MITGDPEAVEAAARALGTAGDTLVETGETVRHRASTLDANWSGTASGAATRAVGELAQRIGAGGPPCSSVDSALITYAQALRDAQREWAAANADAEAGATALEDADADAATARAMPPTIDQEIGSTGVNAASAALTRAAGAQQDARDSIAAAKNAMADAVSRLAQANQAAADAVNDATEQLSEMDGTGARAGGPAEAITEGRARRADDARAESAQADPVGDAVKDVIGGAGDGAWQIGPGAAGWVGGLLPGKVGDAVEGTVQGWHDDLEDWYGADTDSMAYRGTSGAVQVASLAIPGMGLVKGARVVSAVRDVRTLGVVATGAKALSAVRSLPAGAAATARSGVKAVRVTRSILSVGAPPLAKALKGGWGLKVAGESRVKALWETGKKGWAASGWDRAGIYLENGYQNRFRAAARDFMGVPRDQVSLPFPEAGEIIDRYFGTRGHVLGFIPRGSKPFGPSWTNGEAREAEALRELLGLPNENPVRYLIEAEIVKPENVFHVREAIPFDGNPGGGMEYLIYDAENALIVRKVLGVNEAFTHGPEPFLATVKLLL